MKRISIFFLLFCAVFTAYAINVEDYYSTAEGKSGASLKTALNKIIKNHKDVGYKGLWSVYKDTDYKDGQVWDMYSTCNWTYSSDQCGNYSNVCDCYNREHMIPQSWFNEQTPMKSDAFHVYPTDGKVNGIRSNHPHGETNASPIGGKALGKIGSSSVSGYSGTVYEPVDEYKGDIARTYFYFVTRYEDQLSSFDKNDVLTGNTYPSFTDWFYNLMLKWHRQDPVSQKEIDRNEAVYAHQHNRNPFIDYPELVEHVWGNKTNDDFYFNSIEGGGGADNPSDDNNGSENMDCEPIDTTLLVSGIDGFTTYSVSGEQVWFWDSHNYAKMTGYRSGTSYANEDWLISPYFNLSKYASASLSFVHMINYSNSMETEQTLWFSTDYKKNSDPSSATWTQLTGFAYPNGNSWNEVEGVINLPISALEDSVVFAFKYLSTVSASATWEVYNFNLKAICKEVSTQIHTTSTQDSDFQVVSNNNTISISRLPLTSTEIMIFDLSGRLVYSAQSTTSTHTISINKRGLYILKVNDSITKVVVQ